MGLEEKAVFSLLQTLTSDHQIQSAFTRGSFRGSIYVEGVLDANTTFLLSSTPGIVWKRSGLVRHTIDPSDWVKLLTMRDPMMVVKARQWVRVRNGATWFCNACGSLGSPSFSGSSPQDTDSAGGYLVEKKANTHQARTQSV